MVSRSPCCCRFPQGEKPSLYRECDLSCSLSKLNHTDRNDAGISPPSVSAGDTTLFIAAARPVSGRSAFLLSFKAATRHLDPSAISILLSSPRPPLCSGSHTTPFSPHERKKPVLFLISHLSGNIPVCQMYGAGGHPVSVGWSAAICSSAGVKTTHFLVHCYLSHLDHR